MADMLDRIQKRKNRPAVKRDTSFADKLNEKAEDFSAPEAETNNPNSSSKLKQDNIQSQIDSLPVVASRRNIRLLEDIDKELSKMCSNEGITIESFLEASYIYLQKNSESLSIVINDATNRINERKKAGKLRRIASQLSKL